MESTLIVSAILEDFYAANNIDIPTIINGGPNASLLAKSCKVLLTLIRNATIHSELKYRVVRLQNTCIIETIVSVTGALDVLGLAGFRRGSGSGDDAHGSAMENAMDDNDNVLVFTDTPQNQELCGIILLNLEAKLAELQRMGVAVSSSRPPPPPAAATAATAATSPSIPAKTKLQPSSYGPTTTTEKNEGQGVSEAERRRRREVAKASRKARAEERQRALQAWKEDEEDRRTRASRKEAAMVMDCTSADVHPTTAALDSNRESFLVSELRMRRLLNSNYNNNDTAASEPENQHPKPHNLQQPELIPPCSPLLAAVNDINSASQRTRIETPEAIGSAVATGDWKDLDTKPAAVKRGELVSSPSAMVDTEDSNNNHSLEDWKAHLKNTPLCGPAKGIRETSVFHKKVSLETAGGSSPPCLRKLFKELTAMNDSLPSDPRCSIFVRFDEETPQFLRAMIPGALPGPTPYAGGLFVFDIYIPHNYPHVPPKVELVTTGGGTFRFGPNLYACGKVCLSLLGTWEGPKWQPKFSTINQVLISIQGLVLGAEHPYYLEPGHGGWEGTIKEGLFHRTGHILKTGGTVREDLVPRHVAVYENTVRVGTLRFAMLAMIHEMLLLSSGDTNSSDGSHSMMKVGESKASVAAAEGEINDDDDHGDEDDETESHKRESATCTARYLEPFTRPIWFHFFHNRHLILKELQSWTRDNSSQTLSNTAAMVNRHDDGDDDDCDLVKQQAKLLRDIASLYRKLESVLAGLHTPPPLDLTEPISSMGNDAMETSSVPQLLESDLVSAAPASRAEVASRHDVTPKHQDEEEPFKESSNVATTTTVTGVEDIRRRMQEAVGRQDYISAGRLQESLKMMEDLHTRMQQAAAAGNYIRAGKLQEQLNALSMVDDDDHDDAVAQKYAVAAYASALSNEDNDDDEEEENAEDEEQEDDDDDAGGYGDDGWEASFGGTGMFLNEPPKEKTAVQLPSPYKSKRSSGSICRLRIRLPGDPSSVTEQFDGEDTLSDLYEHIEQFVEPTVKPEGVTKGSTTIDKVMRRQPVVTPYGLEMVNDSAFSRPLSLKGFTLLLAHPKREFSLEIHGTQSLKQLGLVPSATLTVMMCQDRGVVRRGDLESRLDEAQGDAMDVEGLSYEGLLELTERVGRKTFEPWTAESKAILESNSFLISPAAYIADLADQNQLRDGNTATNNNVSQDCRCPICLGDFDERDTGNSLRRLHSCRHTFHVACLYTWLETKFCCPLCNQAISTTSTTSVTESSTS